MNEIEKLIEYRMKQAGYKLSFESISNSGKYRKRRYKNMNEIEKLIEYRMKQAEETISEAEKMVKENNNRVLTYERLLHFQKW